MKHVPRRQFLQWGLGTAGVGVLAACQAPTDPKRATGTTQPPAGPTLPAAPATTTPAATTTAPATTTTTIGPPPAPGARSLVVIEMAGGHDGNSLGIPFADASYYARRPSVSVPANQVLPLNSSFGLNPNLARVHQRPLALVEGLGHPSPNFSHSEMLRRWWFGDVDGLQFPRYGFLGRLCDVIESSDAAATGVSLGGGPTAALAAQNAITLSMDPGSDGKFPGYSDPAMNAAWLAGQSAMSQEDRAEANSMLFPARQGIRTALRFSDLMTSIPASTVGYPATGLGAQLSAAVRLLRAGAGIRIIHVPFGGDFDTHEDHLTRHNALMMELDGALDSFLQELGGLGLTQNVLVATTSEFGRRADQNSNGLDHGTATVGMLAGAIHPGVYGAHPNWTTLDSTGNLQCTVTMGQYYATLAQWMGVDPGDVLAGNPAPLAGITL